MYPTDYYTMIRSKDHIFDYRLHMVHSAITLGVKPTARIFKTSAPSVRKWRDRFKAEGSTGLHDRSRAPHSCPHKLSKETEDKIVKLRKRLPGFGAEHLKDEFDLPWGVNSIARVIRQNCKTRIKKKKHQRKNDLRHIKAAYKPCTHFQMDVKYLNDIPHYWPFMQFMGLPRFQYTIRELSTGAQFLTYADEISKTYAILTAKRLLDVKWATKYPFEEGDPEKHDRRAGWLYSYCDGVGGMLFQPFLDERGPLCNLPSLDAGKECTDESQCESYCQAKEGAEAGSQESGLCYGYQEASCMQSVLNGVVQQMWCT